MSPIKRRTEKWLQEHTPRKNDSGTGLRKVKEGRIGRKNSAGQRKKRASFWNLAQWFSNPGKRETDDHDDDDLEGDTVLDDAAASAAAPEHDNDITLVEDEYDQGLLRGDETKRALQKYSDNYLDYNDPRVQEWTEEERWLFTKLTNRGYEPLLHETWIMDYPTFPDQLFTNDENQVYINNIHSSTGRGTHHHQSILVAFCVI